MVKEEVMSEEEFLKLSLVEQFKILEHHSDRALAFAGARRRQLQEETDELDLMLKELTTSRDETAERKAKLVERFGSLEAADAEVGVAVESPVDTVSGSSDAPAAPTPNKARADEAAKKRLVTAGDLDLSMMAQAFTRKPPTSNA